MRTALFCLFVLGLFTLGGCPPKPSPPTPLTTVYDNHFTVNGGAYSNRLFNIVSVSLSTGTYGVNGSSFTEIRVVGKSDSSSSTSSATISIDLEVTGNTAKPYTIDANATTNFGVIDITPTGGSLTELLSKSGTITIGSYGPVGGIISGSFTGKFVNGADVYDISGSAFKVTRQQ